MNTTNINNTIEEPKSTLVFTPITESQSQDSYVYKSEVGDVVVKMYYGINTTTLKKYSEIQNTLAITSFGDCMFDDLTMTYQGICIKRIVVTILEIPDEVSTGSLVSNCSRNREKVSITTPVFVEGPTLRDAYVEDDFSRSSILIIAHTLAKFLYGAAELNKIEGVAENFENVKITSFQKGELNLVITDVSRDIRHTVSMNNSILYRYCMKFISFLKNLS